MSSSYTHSTSSSLPPATLLRMKPSLKETWLDYVTVALPGIGLIVSYYWPYTWPFLLATAIVAALPLFLATFRGILDRRSVSETFPTLAFILLLVSRDWTAAAAITLILGIVRLVEQRMEARAFAALDAHQVDLKTLRRLDEYITVHAGETVPADGVVTHGTAFVYQGLVTGDIEPVERLTGDSVFAGTVVRAGSIKIRVSAIGEHMLMMRMRNLIQDAHQWPSTTERVASHVSAFSYWVLVVLAMAVWFFFQDLGRLAALLLVLRPDALGAAVALSSSLASGAAGRLGAMIRGGDALDRLAAADIVIFDKSGPLTFSEIRIGRLEHDPEVSDAYVWECIAVAEESSRHPVGRALYREAMRHIGRVSHADSVQEYPNRGVVAMLGGHEIVIGTAELQRACCVSFNGDWLAGSTTPVEGRVSDAFLALDGRCVARLRIEEHERKDVTSTLEQLRALGIKRDILFTPDTIRIAAKQAMTIGLTDYRPSMSPEEKWKELGRLSQEGKTLVLGDGLRDAEAMHRAFVGVALAPDGAAIEAAHVTFATEDLTRLPSLFLLARTFRSVVRLQSLIWITTGALGLIVAAAGWLSPVSATAYVFTTSLVLHVFTLRVMPKPFSAPSRL